MANLIQLRRKIKTAKSISKATKAMQMIAASKLRKAQEEALSSRPYSEKLNELINIGLSKLEDGFKHPYLNPPKGKTDLFLVISSDKGLAGGMNANLAREIVRQTGSKQSKFVNIGKKIESFL